MEVVGANQFPKRAILYYPTIDVPSSGWLRQAILYWDKVNSIIPKDYDGRLLANLSSEIRYLMDEDEFAPVHPEQLLKHQPNRDAFHEFQKEFIAITSDPGYQLFLKKRAYQYTKRIKDKPYYSRIHRNKTSDAVYRHLDRMKLIRETKEHEWYQMETNTALLYMSLLAKYLAGVQENQTTIGTNYGIYERMNFKRVGDSVGYPVVSLSLNRLLPTPEQNVPIKKIIAFKRKRKANLIRFRKVLLDYQKDIGKASSAEELKSLTNDFAGELTLGIKDLKATLKDSKISSRVKTIRSLINFQSAPAVIATGALVSDIFNLLPSNIAVPVAAVSGGIELGLNFLENRIEQRGIIRDSAFSYVYQAQEAGIIRRFR